MTDEEEETDAELEQQQNEEHHDVIHPDMVSEKRIYYVFLTEQIINLFFIISNNFNQVHNNINNLDESLLYP
jgi:hypothetical protein